MKKYLKFTNNQLSIILTFTLMFGLILGMLFGAIMYNKMITNSMVKVAEGLEGTTFNLEVDFNETEIVNGITSFYKPYFEEILNATP